MNKSEIKCFFDHHEYTIPDKHNPGTLICRHCKRFGYVQYPGGSETWREYNKEGRVIYYKTSYGSEIWYDEEGNIINFR